MTDIRVTREAIEVLAVVDTDPAIQTTRIAVEVLTNLDTAPVIQMTRVAIEVLFTEGGAEPAVVGTRREMITITYT